MTINFTVYVYVYVYNIKMSFFENYRELQARGIEGLPEYLSFYERTFIATTRAIKYLTYVREDVSLMKLHLQRVLFGKGHDQHAERYITNFVNNWKSMYTSADYVGDMKKLFDNANPSLY